MNNLPRRVGKKAVTAPRETRDSPPLAGGEITEMSPPDGAVRTRDLPLSDARFAHWFPPAGFDCSRLRTVDPEADPHSAGGALGCRTAADQWRADYLRRALLSRRHVRGGRPEVLPALAGCGGQSELFG